MNYYERHLGDYAKDTAHLSMLEHGAYTLLLDRYYSTEQGIPEDQVYRLARARSKEERAAVDAVLVEFFKLSAGVWMNGRCEEEIPKALARIGTAQANGRKGGRPKKPKPETQEKPAGFSAGFENETQPKAHHAPDTRHHTNTEPAATLTVVGREPEADVSGFVPTPAGLICQALRKAGLGSVNPSHPRLTALIAAGATAEEFLAFAPKAIAEGDEPFAYLLGAVEGERKRAARTAGQIHRGPMKAANRQVAIEVENKRVADQWVREQEQADAGQ